MAQLTPSPGSYGDASAVLVLVLGTDITRSLEGPRTHLYTRLPDSRALELIQSTQTDV